MFSNLFHKDYSLFCLRTSKRISLGELIYHGFYHIYTMVNSCSRVYYMGLEYVLEYFSVSGTFWKTLVIIELFEVQNCTDASDIYYG